MPENVLLITIDSLRGDYVEGFEETTTHIESLSSLGEEGISFSRAFATGPGTQPSFPALLTGTHLLSYGGLGPLTDERPRIACQFRERQFSTGGFHSNPFLSAYFDYDVGFETFRDYQNPLMGVATRLFPRGIEVNNARLRKVDQALGVTNAIKRLYRMASGKARPYVSAEVVADDVIDWIETTDESFFCWTHFMDVHHPCYPPVEYRSRRDVSSVPLGDVSNIYSTLIDEPDRLDEIDQRRMKSLYKAAIDYVDDQIHRLVACLKRTGRYDDTLIVVTSDHGEMFGEHGVYGKPPRMFEELLRVPLVVVNGPAGLEETKNDLVSLIDVPPLIHDSVGLEIPDAYAGRLPYSSGQREYVLAEHEIEGDPVIGVRSDSMTYEYDSFIGEERTYEVTDDTAFPNDDLSPSSQLLGVVRERLQQFDPGGDYELEATVDGDVERRLQELGYL
jgi:arylsulfatase A-like enzyme